MWRIYVYRGAGLFSDPLIFTGGPMPTECVFIGDNILRLRELGNGDLAVIYDDGTWVYYEAL